MITHEQIWIAIDQLARMRGYSTSGLARRAGLDPTAFNPSKRVGRDGKLRWPSTESLIRILDVTELELFEFAQFIIAPASVNSPSPAFMSPPSPPPPSSSPSMRRTSPPPMITIDGDLYAPIYRAGDRLILSSVATMSVGDRIALSMTDAPLIIGELTGMSDGEIELLPLQLIARPAPISPNAAKNPKNYNLILNKSLIKWVGRVMWASR